MASIAAEDARGPYFLNNTSTLRQKVEESTNKSCSKQILQTTKKMPPSTSLGGLSLAAAKGSRLASPLPETREEEGVHQSCAALRVERSVDSEISDWWHMVNCLNWAPAQSRIRMDFRPSQTPAQSKELERKSGTRERPVSQGSSRREGRAQEAGSGRNGAPENCGVASENSHQRRREDLDPASVKWSQPSIHPVHDELLSIESKRRVRLPVRRAKYPGGAPLQKYAQSCSRC